MEKAQSRPSLTTQLNWWLDAAVALGAALSILTGIYFLYLPIGGYQGGRNPTYGIRILFERHTWDDLHMWGGLLMIVAVIVHLWYHRSWVGMMTRKMAATLRGEGGRLSRGAKVNILVDSIIAISFLLTAVSGIYFLFEPARGAFLITSATWDVIHTWAAVTLVLAAIAHLYIHWLWVTKVTAKMFRPRRPISNRQKIDPVSG
ncbi:MAG: DUF4405 domain-containing protein [Caldilineales bacterium]|nr:DUF4405 domain-containing protein [Caldilineales bacterium]